jgi:hypothetical protein
MDFGTALERRDFTCRDGCFNPEYLLAEPAANGEPATCSLARKRPLWVEGGGGRAPPIIYCASVSRNLRCVSVIVRRTPLPSQLICVGKDALLRIGPFIIARRYYHARG